MKFYLFLFSVILLAACQKPKNWTCNCDYDTALYGKGTTSFDMENEKQRDASERCTNYTNKLTENTSGTATCKLSVK